jgi:uncharacterized Zn-finger protein
LVKEIQQAGGCAHPIRLRGEFVNGATGEVNERRLLVACKDRRAVVCPSCSYLYKADAWIVVSTGLIGGKGVPASVVDHPRLFLTLTAPSFGAVHRRSVDGSCQSRHQPRCRHGRAMSCSRRHDDTDPVIGSPLCVSCFDYTGAVLWNAESSRLWNRTFEQIRRRLAITLDLTNEELAQHVRLSYLKVTEFQRRGLAHFHVVLRADGPGKPFSPPPSFLTAAQLGQVITSVVKDFSITTPRDVVAWGYQFRIADASTLERDDLRIAAYLAKYATKSTDGSLDFARRFRGRSEILKLDVAPHLQRLALTTWDLALEPALLSMNLRAHAHAFGVRGQLITKSRHYSTRFQDLREARAAYMTRPQSDDPVAGTFTYDGRGYDDPRAASIAEFLHQLSVEVRRATPLSIIGDTGGE